jgi:hypothetical protein
MPENVSLGNLNGRYRVAWLRLVWNGIGLQTLVHREIKFVFYSRGIFLIGKQLFAFEISFTHFQFSLYLYQCHTHYYYYYYYYYYYVVCLHDILMLISV